VQGIVDRGELPSEFSASNNGKDRTSRVELDGVSDWTTSHKLFKLVEPFGPPVNRYPRR
jgi:hypothetical protein